MAMIKDQKICTYNQWLVAVGALGRLDPAQMTQDELDLAAALLYVRPALTGEQSDEVSAGKLVPQLRAHLAVQEGSAPRVLQEDGQWMPFAVTHDWNAYGLLTSVVGLVTGTHEAEDDGQATVWHSCHAYFSGTSVEGYDGLRITVAECAARLLKLRPRA